MCEFFNLKYLTRCVCVCVCVCMSNSMELLVAAGHPAATLPAAHRRRTNRTNQYPSDEGQQAPCGVHDLRTTSLIPRTGDTPAAPHITGNRPEKQTSQCTGNFHEVSIWIITSSSQRDGCVQRCWNAGEEIYGTEHLNKARYSIVHVCRGCSLFMSDRPTEEQSLCHVGNSCDAWCDYCT